VRAIVADDSRVFRVWLAELLRDHGFEVVEAGNGREALDQILDCRPELVVLDALMPLLSGFDVLKSMREKAPGYAPTIFMVTAVYKSRRWESEARQQYQVHEYLEKPIEHETIVTLLGHHFPVAK
jgi:two-component system chemotaxis response regulator CheY